MSTAIDADSHLAPGPANYAALTPLSFLARAAAVAADKAAVVHGDAAFTYAEFYARVRRFASTLAARGIGRGDVVSVMAPNVPALLEAYYAVPMVGAVLNPLNYRLDAKTIAFILDHADSKLLISDTEFSATIEAALEEMDAPPEVVDIDDPLFDGDGKRLGEIDYEAFLAAGDPAFVWELPDDEWQSVHLGDHRQSQGRALPPPRRLSERAWQRAGLRALAGVGLSVDAGAVEESGIGKVGT